MFFPNYNKHIYFGDQKKNGKRIKKNFLRDTDVDINMDSYIPKNKTHTWIKDLILKNQNDAYVFNMPNRYIQEYSGKSMTFSFAVLS